MSRVVCVVNDKDNVTLNMTTDENVPSVSGVSVEDFLCARAEVVAYLDRAVEALSRGAIAYIVSAGCMRSDKLLAPVLDVVEELALRKRQERIEAGGAR